LQSSPFDFSLNAELRTLNDERLSGGASSFREYNFNQTASDGPIPFCKAIPLDILINSGYILPIMKYQVVIAKSAQETFKKLDAQWRSSLKKAMRTHLEKAPKQESKSRIKCLKGLRQPQYRLRVDKIRVFYDVNDEQGRVEVLGFVMKPDTVKWLQNHGVPE
jgi:mRNA interferase RelE/StbE